MPKIIRTKQELCDDVYTFVRDAGVPVTRNEICKGLGLSKSPHVIKMAEALAADGWLKKSEDVDKWGRAVFVYGIGIEISSDVHKACDGLIDEPLKKS